MSRSSAKPPWLPHLGVSAAALAIRIAWVLVASVEPRAGFNFDASWYDIMAGWLAQGHGYTSFSGEPTAAWPPGYPAFLGLLYRVFGNETLVAQLANALLGALTAALTYELGRRLFDGRVALVAAALFSLRPGHVFFSALPMSEGLFSLLFTAACLAFARETVSPGVRGLRWALWGAWLGLCTLVRGTTLAFLGVSATLWLLVSRDLRLTAWRSVAALLGFALVVGPWMVRNFLVFDDFVLISTSFGRTLAIAHLPRGSYERRYQELRRSAGEVELDRHQRREVFAYVCAHPGRTIARIPGEILDLYARDDVALNWGRLRGGSGDPQPVLAGVPDSLVRGAANAFHYGVLALALLGLPAACARDRPDRWIVPAAILYVTLLHSVVFQGNPRFQVPLAPHFSLLAAVGMARGAGWFRGAQRAGAGSSSA